jgi:hypothetical protein
MRFQAFATSTSDVGPPMFRAAPLLRFQLSINAGASWSNLGATLSLSYAATGLGCPGWTKMFADWIAPSNVTDLRLRLINGQTAASGNDFAVDDIFFGLVTAAPLWPSSTSSASAAASLSPSASVFLNKTCGRTYSPTGGPNEGLPLYLSCPGPRDGFVFVISTVLFASYGTPAPDAAALPACGFVLGGCHAGTSAAVVGAACLGKTQCTLLSVVAAFGDPCLGTQKWLAASVACAPACAAGTYGAYPVCAACPVGFFCAPGANYALAALPRCGRGNYCPAGSAAPTGCPPGAAGGAAFALDTSGSARQCTGWRF